MAKIDIQGALKKTNDVIKFLDNILGEDNPEIRAEMKNLREKVSNIYGCFLESQKEIVSNSINEAELKKLMKETEEKILNVYQEIQKTLKYPIKKGDKEVS